ncbi:Schizosaccharomyces specific protein [Schizosaccharomyces osmophilus]|uniref:Schizosaccharomyces specific protein n=1 Tax=Schizosaccharomyces osmophilus TaxID=2545709 RepID=A0AAF0AWF6_9SCHI|nr:Schizosaccharomyces specific protein [Schizosaccharomyces osmophilus]WBW74641.1 Schizosaccharomyces specific protein [Schizosaccharomyces osmophilus]
MNRNVSEISSDNMRRKESEPLKQETGGNEGNSPTQTNDDADAIEKKQDEPVQENDQLGEIIEMDSQYFEDTSATLEQDEKSSSEREVSTSSRPAHPMKQNGLHIVTGFPKPASEGRYQGRQEDSYFSRNGINPSFHQPTVPSFPNVHGRSDGIPITANSSLTHSFNYPMMNPYMAGAQFGPPPMHMKSGMNPHSHFQGYRRPQVARTQYFEESIPIQNHSRNKDGKHWTGKRGQRTVEIHLNFGIPSSSRSVPLQPKKRITHVVYNSRLHQKNLRVCLPGSGSVTVPSKSKNKFNMNTFPVPMSSFPTPAPSIPYNPNFPAVPPFNFLPTPAMPPNPSQPNFFQYDFPPQFDPALYPQVPPQDSYASMNCSPLFNPSIPAASSIRSEAPLASGASNPPALGVGNDPSAFYQQTTAPLGAAYPNATFSPSSTFPMMPAYWPYPAVYDPSTQSMLPPNIAPPLPANDTSLMSRMNSDNVHPFSPSNPTSTPPYGYVYYYDPNQYYNGQDNGPKPS